MLLKLFDSDKLKDSIKLCQLYKNKNTLQSININIGRLTEIFQIFFFFFRSIK